MYRHLTARHEGRDCVLVVYRNRKAKTDASNRRLRARAASGLEPLEATLPDWHGQLSARGPDRAGRGGRQGAFGRATIRFQGNRPGAKAVSTSSTVNPAASRSVSNSVRTRRRPPQSVQAEKLTMAS